MSASNDGTLLYSSGGARYQLAWFGRDGTLLGTVGAIEQYIGLRLSPDGREVLVTIRDGTGNGDLWRIDLASGVRSRVTSEGGWNAVWSPDSQQVAFTALTRREALQTVKARGGGEAQTLLTVDGTQLFPSDWSFDSTKLAYSAISSTSYDVWLLPMMRASKPEQLLRSPFNELHAQFSPDGKWLAFTSNESGRDDVHVQSLLDPAIRKTVSNTGGAYPRWNPSGRELFYRASDGHLMSIPVRLAPSDVEFGTTRSIVMRFKHESH